MTRKTTFFEGFSSFKFNNLGLALGMVLKFYATVAKGLNLKVRKFWRLIPTFIEVTGKKLVVRWWGAGGFLHTASWIELNVLTYQQIFGIMKTNGLITLFKYPIKYLELVPVLINIKLSILSILTSQIFVFLYVLYVFFGSIKFLFCYFCLSKSQHY